MAVRLDTKIVDKTSELDVILLEVMRWGVAKR